MAADDSINMGTVMRRLRAVAKGVPLSVLLVDDDEIERGVLAALLQTAGVTVGEAEDAPAALAQVEERAFPVVLIDWQMPGTTGVELTEQLRERGFTDTYILMLTSRDSEFDIERGYLAGVDDYVSKRVRDVELLARVHLGMRTVALRTELRVLRAALAAANGGNP